MSITTGDIVRIVASCLFTDGNVAQMVFNAVITGAGGPWDDLDIVADSVTWMNAVMAHLTTKVTETLDGNEIIVYVYDPIDDDWDEVGSDSFPWNPSSVGDALPRAVSGLVNCKTTDPDVNGKKYVPGLTESASTDGSWIAGTITALADFADEWLTPLVGFTSGADWTPGVWSPTRTSFLMATGAHVIPIEPAYQRRRKRGIGV